MPSARQLSLLESPGAPVDDVSLVLESFAVRQPAAPALHAPGRKTLTYADLGAQIRYVRERLANWGVARGDLIAGVIPQRPEMAVACATVPAAATFAPLSPTLTPYNYTELLTRLRPKALVVRKGQDHAVRAVARQCGIAEIDLAADLGAPAGMFTLDLLQRQESLSRGASSRPEWAYVLNTSGTTGRPKLVPLSHRRLALNAHAQGEWLQLATSDVGCHLVPSHHSLGLSSALMIPLLRGASVVCLPESDIDAFFAALGEYRITWLPAVFTVYRAILRRAPDFAEAVAGNSLRVMRLATGRLEPDEIERIEATFGAPLLTGFAMTEAYTITHEPLPPRARKRGSVGVPVCNEVAIMNESGAICATGVVGEIVVRGPMVFDGYFDDAQATAAAFVDGWFRTGDLGRFDEDGYLYLAGRIKDLINCGGEKISPVELDAAVEAIPGVLEAATFALNHRTLGEEVAVAVVKEGNVTITESDIIDRVRQRVGPRRAPRRIYFVDQLPRTYVGKVRRAELPRLLGLDQPGAAAPVEPAPQESATVPSALEAALAGLWISVLQVKHVGRDDDFFLLGGDSLRGARLLTSVNAVFGVELTIQALFGEASTVAGMARAIEKVRSAGATVGQE